MKTHYVPRTGVTFCLSVLIPFLSLAGAFAGNLQEASVNKIVKDVEIVEPSKGARRAVINETIHDDLGIYTGVQSRAELLFQDNTLARLGGETFFSFKPGTRELHLDKGTLLLQVPKGLGGAQIHTASVTASITGTTIMMEYLPAKMVKVLVLEGSLKLSMNNHFGETVLLTPGKMIVMNPAAKRLPNPLDVNIQRVIKTSPLIKDSDGKGKSKTTFSPLPSSGLIDKEIAKQNVLIEKHQLVSANLIIKGGASIATVVADALPEGKQKKISASEAQSAEVDLASNSEKGSISSFTQTSVANSLGMDGRDTGDTNNPKVNNITAVNLIKLDLANFGVQGNGQGNDNSQEAVTGNGKGNGNGNGNGHDNETGNGKSNGNENGNGNGHGHGHGLGNILGHESGD